MYLIPLIKIDYKLTKYFHAANKSLATKNWKKAINYIESGREKCGDSVLGFLSAGKYYLKVNNTVQAKSCFEQAIRYNPGVNIKKELASISVLEGNYSQAISHLQSHLQLNPVDWEAYNLLAECFFRIQRFETALEILESVIYDAKVDCLWNNWYILKNCIDNTFFKLSRDIGKNVIQQHFIKFNFNLIKSMNDNNIYGMYRWRKFIFQDYRFNKYTSKNSCSIILENNRKKEYDTPLIAVGRNTSNDLVIDDNSVSRLHCVIINYLKDVWIVDLGSKFGIYVDDKKIQHKQFLLGKHRICIGDYELNFYSSSGILI